MFTTAQRVCVRLAYNERLLRWGTHYLRGVRAGGYGALNVNYWAVVQSEGVAVNPWGYRAGVDGCVSHSKKIQHVGLV